MTWADLGRELHAGGRFVVFPYCISALVITYRSASSVRFLRAGEDGFGSALGFTLLTLVLGWWGIPWGPIRSCSALYHCLRGGREVTPEVLAAVGGLVRPPQLAIEQTAPRRTSWRMWGLRAGVFGALLLPIALIGVIAKIGAQADRELAQRPGYAEFSNADRWLTRSVEAEDSGNSAAAVAIAKSYSEGLTAFRAQSTTESLASPRSPTAGDFLTWCELRQNRLILLVRVPNLRRYDRASKDIICEMAWRLAVVQAAKHFAGQEMPTVVVGVRGLALYERVMIGHPSGDTPEALPAESLADGDGRKQLADSFAAAAGVPATPEK